MAVEMVGRLRQLDLGWSPLHFGDVAVETVDGQHVFSVDVHLGGLSRGGASGDLQRRP